MRKYGAKVKEAAINNAQLKGKYTTGATRRSINLQAGGNQAVIEALTNYSGYVEVGTRKMEAQPFMKPALEEVVPDMVEEMARWDET